MSWPACAFAAFVATLLLTALEAGAQQLALTRMSIPYLMGAVFTANRDRAKALGMLVHLVAGQLFGLGYVALFRSAGHSEVWFGALVGLAHGLVLLLAVAPVLPGIHPRMASVHQGPTGTRQLEPPGPLALYYGFSTPLAVLVSHAVYGAVLAALCR